MTVTAQDYLNVLRGFIGTAENPANSNRTWIGEEYGFNGVAWCCETQSVAQVHAGAVFFKEAAVVRAVAAAQRGDNGLVWLEKEADPQPGDLICFKFPTGHHIGSVEAPVPGEARQWFTLEGNTRFNDMRRMVRDDKYVMGWIRMPLDVDAPPQSPVPEHPALGHPWLRQGSRGMSVIYLQRTLVNKANQRLGRGGLTGIGDDGVFGPKTVTAVKNLQKFFRLTADGVVGPKTWAVVDELATR